MEETIPIVKAQGDVKIVGLMVSLNRCEKGKSDDKTALDEIKELYGFDAHAIVSMKEVIDYLTSKGMLDDELMARINDYYAQYGVN